VAITFKASYYKKKMPDQSAIKACFDLTTSKSIIALHGRRISAIL
jgi:hypothetical protein